MNRQHFVYGGLAVVFIIAAALNYNALQHFAYEQAQVNFWLSFGVPVLFDTFIAIAAYIALINKEQDESTRLAKGIVLAFTVASIYLNGMHYPPTLAGWSMAALVPLVVLLSVELALQQMEIKHRRSESIATIERLQTQVQKTQATLRKIEDETAQKTAEQDAIVQGKIVEIEQKTRVLQDIVAQIEAAELQLAQLKIAQAEAENCTLDWSGREANLLRLDGMLAAGVSYAQAAKTLNIAPNTARNWARQLNGNSLSAGQVRS